jgi:hypothetical protein
LSMGNLLEVTSDEFDLRRGNLRVRGDFAD